MKAVGRPRSLYNPDFHNHHHAGVGPRTEIDNELPTKPIQCVHIEGILFSFVNDDFFDIHFFPVMVL